MPHHFYDTCAYFTAARYMRTVDGLVNQFFQPTGMKPAYSYIMMALEDEHPQTVTKTAAKLGYERSSIYRMAQKLEQKGLVTFYNDGKSATIDLLPASKDFLTIANQCLADWGQFTDDKLGTDKSELVKLLNISNTKLRS